MSQRIPDPSSKADKKAEAMQALKFTLFSISAGVIQLLVSSLMMEVFHLDYWVSYLTALVLSVLWNFTFNRRYTFRSDCDVPKAMLLVALYYAVFTPLSTWWGDALTKAGWNEYVVLLGTMLINFITEFLFQKFVVYRNAIDTNDVARRAREREAMREQEHPEAGK